MRQAAALKPRTSLLWGAFCFVPVGGGAEEYRIWPGAWLGKGERVTQETQFGNDLRLKGIDTQKQQRNTQKTQGWKYTDYYTICP